MATVNFKGTPIKLAGNELKVGDAAPEVKVVAGDLSEKKVGGAQGIVQVLLAVPSLDTPVCAMQTRKFNQNASEIAGAQVTVISMDLPFASSRFCAAEGIRNVVAASDFRDKTFAKSYGVLLDEGPLSGLTCRAVFVVGRNGKITYRELVPDITSEPDYAAALVAAKQAAG
ncbi:MAG: thiol peroxidase [Elusimicrobiota bacterium]